MNKSCSMKPRVQARGVIPSKVSELENDLDFVSQEQLDRISTYTGIENSSAKVLVDDSTKTIEVLVKSSPITDSLPKDDKGKFKEGTYLLRAVVVNGIPTLEWGEATGGSVTNPYYYGQVKIDSVEDLTSGHIKDLIADGLIKSNKEYQFKSEKQRQVLAYPAEFGELSSIVHKETGFTVTSAFEKIELNIDGVPYYVYISYNPSTGTYTYLFNY